MFIILIKRLCKKSPKGWASENMGFSFVSRILSRSIPKSNHFSFGKTLHTLIFYEDLLITLVININLIEHGTSKNQGKFLCGYMWLHVEPETKC